MNIKNIVGIFFVGLIVFFVTAYSMYMVVNKDQISTNISEITEEDVVEEKDVVEIETAEEAEKKEYVADSNTNLIFKYNYIDEGYQEIEEKPLNINMGGLKIEEIEKIYDSWELKSYDDNKIYFEKEISTKDEHKYVVSIQDGYVAVFEHENGNLNLIQKTNKSTNELFENDLTLLNNGIKVKDDSELLKILADFES